jgi:hypothetical protein
MTIWDDPPWARKASMWSKSRPLRSRSARRARVPGYFSVRRRFPALARISQAPGTCGPADAYPPALRGSLPLRGGLNSFFLCLPLAMLFCTRSGSALLCLRFGYALLCLRFGYALLGRSYPLPASFVPPVGPAVEFFSPTPRPPRPARSGRARALPGPA